MKELLFINSKKTNIESKKGDEKINFDQVITICDKEIKVGEQFSITVEMFEKENGLKERLNHLEKTGYITFIGKEVVELELDDLGKNPATNKKHLVAIPESLVKSQEARFKELLNTAKK